MNINYNMCWTGKHKYANVRVHNPDVYIYSFMYLWFLEQITHNNISPKKANVGTHEFILLTMYENMTKPN